jgi:hypothetical protein
MSLLSRVSLTGMGVSGAAAVPLLTGGNRLSVALGTAFAIVTGLWAVATSGSLYTDQQR